MQSYRKPSKWVKTYKDDFELAIGSYVDDMSQELYDAISDGRSVSGRVT